jgi:hypothetical protein
MKTTRILRAVTVSLACVGVTAPQLALAVEPPRGGLWTSYRQPAAPGPLVASDVALGPGGELRGQVIDLQGQALEGRQVAFHQDGQVIAQPISDRTGQFSVNGLGGGVYQVSTATDSGVYRLWAPNTAPPPAQGQMTLVDNPAAAVPAPVVRGQFGVLSLLSNPWVVGALIATAIAVPLAIANDKDDPPPAS